MTMAMKPSVSPTPDWKARGISASGIRAARPTNSEPTASAMNAGIRSQVMSSTTSATPMIVTRSRGVGSTGLTMPVSLP